MTPDTPGPGDGAQDIDETGEPIAELRDLSVAVDERFGRRVRSRIERRVLTGELLGLAWSAPLTMLLELLRLPFERLGGKRKT